MQEKSTTVNPIGLYKDPESGNFMGCIEEIQADAAKRAGYVLVESGREAAMTPEADYPTDEKAPAKKASK
jgi:hypothetical protein